MFSHILNRIDPEFLMAQNRSAVIVPLNITNSVGPSLVIPPNMYL